MSYFILYKSMFVETKRGIIPMFECGDNNVYDADGRRRSRDWEGLHFKSGKKFYTHSELCNILQDWNTDYQTRLAEDLASDDEWKKAGGSFGFYQSMSVGGKHTTGTTFADIKNMFTSGEKMMVSIDFAIQKLGLYIGHYVKKEGDKWSNFERIKFSSEEEMFDIIDKQFDGGTKNFWFHFNDYSANNVYEWQKAISCLLSNKTGRKPKYGDNKEFILVVSKDNKSEKKYVGVENGTLILTDNVKFAHVFKKYKAGGKNIYEIIFHLFPEIRCCHYEYDYNKLLDNAA